MSFDRPTRNALGKMVGACRRLLTEDVRAQLQQTYGLQPDGQVLPVERLAHLDEQGRETAAALREWQDHLAAQEVGPETDRRAAAFERIAHETAFTVLNRLAALRMCEERGLVIECVRRGMESDGFSLFDRLAGGMLGPRPQTYRSFLEGLFDELSVDMGILFDRRVPQSMVFPGDRCLEEVLSLLNDKALAHLWKEDETIGWIYQFFNSKEEREAMRKASQAPRSSRELAVRNQFFTPRYVVEFLSDNTLGRIWYEMRKGETALKEECRYLGRRPNEVFLAPGEKAPAAEENEADLSQEELLKKPVHIEHRPKKDPRDLRVLDPACGSGHFLLYAFDLLERIYQEAWEDPESPESEVTGRTLREEYETLDDLRRTAPKLIIEHNLHGIDIDPRAVQIAALALWLRAQKSWKSLGLKAAERPRIDRSNIVTAEPMPGEEDMRREFTAGLKPRLLGQLVEAIVEKMKITGESGSLLKIEEEIKDVVARAKKQWQAGPKKEQIELFPEAVRPKAEQLGLFDMSGITDNRFWEEAEGRILEGLQAYAEQAGNGKAFQRRLFAEDAAHGFAFIDLCRKHYDVVLMNPPFGEFSKQWKEEAKAVYPNSYNDILGAFVERFLHRLASFGRLAAITSRTCFFLTSFTDWRLNVVLKDSALCVIADLGQGVMDEAMVEAAAYVLERSTPTTTTTVFRAIADEDREAAVKACVDASRDGKVEPRVFLADQAAFHLLPDSPFVYWIDGRTIRQFSLPRRFEPDVGSVRQGLATGDDPRFVRTLWEVAPEDTQFCYYPTTGENFCRFDDPIVQAFFRRRSKGTPRWAFHVKSGASQPWYSPITLKLNWAEGGAELRNFTDAKGKLRSRPQNVLFYYRPGFSWTRRAVRFYPYVIPGNCIPSVSRYMAFPEHGKQVEALGVCASRLASAFLRFYGEKFEWPNFLVENVKMLPWPEVSEDARRLFESVMTREVEQRRLAYQNHEPFHEFLLPAKVRDLSRGGQALAFDPTSLLGEEGERLVAEAFGFTPEQSTAVERDLQEAISYQKRGGASGETEGEEEEENTDFVLGASPRATEETGLSYFVGCIFGRWDIRIALDPSLAPKLANPFDPLPVCPPGMLVGPDGLPADSGRIASEEWLRARPDASTLPPEGSVKNPTILDTDYPLRVSWDGVLVDDAGWGGSQPHRDDIIRRVREVLDLLWKDKAPEIEQEACDILAVSDLRDYFRKPAGFFQDHLRRYSKSRRQAPIYWPLSTASGLYTLWIYYHRLNADLLYKAVNDYVNPKISETERWIAQLETDLASATGRQATILRGKLEEAKLLREELEDFKAELLRVAGLPYKPDLNDGVLTTASPLWKLFRLPKWRKELETCWQELEAGEYDWAHLAYAIWPDRVKAASKRDRSIAIAHGLESLYEGPPAGASRSNKRKGKGTR